MGAALHHDELNQLESVWQSIGMNLDKNSQRVIDSERKGFKEVRVFVSSTFKDFFAEREVLVKYVFPRLREWCLKRKLILVEIDLRWGVPANASEYAIMSACLGEIDLCKQENINAFFLNMLGDRYGWVPRRDQVPDIIANQYQWVEGCSITHMEILHGAYRNCNPNALFMIRSDSFIKNLPQEFLPDYIETQWSPRVALSTLKEYIRYKFSHTGQVVDYNLSPKGVDSTTVGIPKLLFDGLEYFSEQVYEFLRNAIDRQYPVVETNSSCTSEELLLQLSDVHDNFAYIHAQFAIGRDIEIAQIIDWTQSISDVNLPMLIFGEKGSGKSTLMAALAVVLKDCSNSEIVFHSLQSEGIYHTLDISDIRELNTILKLRLCIALGDDEVLCRVNELLQHLNSYLDIKTDELSMCYCNMMNKMKFKHGITDTSPAIILIDEGDLLQLWKESSITFLPKNIPNCVRFIISSSCQRLIDKAHYFSEMQLSVGNSIEDSKSSLIQCNTSIDTSAVLVIPLLPISVKESIIKRRLSTFNKQLDQNQILDLLDNPGINNMEWITLACEDIRSYGAFETISQHIKILPTTVPQLLKQLLSSIENASTTCGIHEIRHCIRDSLLLLATCKSGLEEEELRSLLCENNESGNSSNTILRVDWSIVRLLLSPLLRSSISRSAMAPRIIIKSFQTCNMVRDYYAGVLENDRNTYLFKLINFFEKSNNPMRLQEDLPTLLIDFGDMRRLRKYTRSESFKFVRYELRIRVINVLRCTCTIPLVPAQYKPKEERICMVCSMKSTFGSQLNRLSCCICGDKIFSRYETRGGVNSVIMNQAESITYMCRQHNSSAYVSTVFKPKCYICKFPVEEKLSFPMVSCRKCTPVLGNNMTRCAYIREE